MSQENVELVRRIYDGWSRGDFGVGSELITPDFEWRQHAEAVEPGSRSGGAIGGSLKKIFEIYENFHVEPEEFIDAGNKIVVVAQISATERRTGMPLEGGRWGFVWTVRNGRLARNEVYSERADALEAAGLSE